MRVGFFREGCEGGVVGRGFGERFEDEPGLRDQVEPVAQRSFEVSLGYSSAWFCSAPGLCSQRLTVLM